MRYFHPIWLLPFALQVSCAQPGKKDLLASGVDSPGELFQAMQENRQWPSYRGFYASGYMDDAGIPDSFDVETGHHILWQREVPGLGLSCPVIWDDRVYFTTAIGEEDGSGYLTGVYGDIEPVEDTSVHTWKVFCLDRLSGAIIWERVAHRGRPTVKRHPKSSHANTTVATDGYHVVVFFGSEGLYCYDLEGKLLWKRDLGPIISAWNEVESAEWEFCSSPVLFRDRVVIQADALNTSFVAVLDLHSGKTVWRQERQEIAGWCTPNIYFDGNRPRVVVNGYRHRGGYDLHTGEEIWKMEGGGDIPIPTPVVWKDLIFFNSAHGRHAPLMAVKNRVSGVVLYPDSDTAAGPPFAWFYDRGGSYMTSVLVYDSLVYRLRWNGNLACFEARSGKPVYQETVDPSSFIASPVASDGRLFLVSEDGDLYIVRAGRRYELLRKLPLGNVSLVTPGISPGIMIFRTAGKLIAISKFTEKSL